MPFAEDRSDQISWKKILKSVTFCNSVCLDDGYTPEQMLEAASGKDLDLEITDTMPTQFYCNCSKERVESAVGKCWEERRFRI